jgi:hypothetical protein
VLLLKASLAIAPGAATWWQRYWAGGLIREHTYLLGAVYQQLEKAGYPGPGLAEVQRAYLAIWTHHLQTQQVADQALQDLQAAGLQPLLLKGLAVSCLLDWQAHRAMDDFDVLIRPHDLDTAARLLCRQGWTPEQPPPDPALRAIQHSLSWHKEGHSLDLHWFVMPEKLDPLQDDECRARAQTIQLQGHSCLALESTDLLLHALVHGCKSGSSHGWVLDSCGLLQRAQLDWPRFLGQAVQRQVVLQCLTTLTFLSQQMQAPVPPSVLQALTRLRVSPLDRLYFQVKTRPRRLWSLLLWPLLEYYRLPPSQRATGFCCYLRRRWALQGGLLPEVARRLNHFRRHG